MEGVITPTEAIALVWAGGAVVSAAQLYRAMRRIDDRDCVCTRPRMNHVGALTSAAPVFAPAVLLVLIAAAGLAWPVLVPFLLLNRARHRFGRDDADRRCEHCSLPTG